MGLRRRTFVRSSFASLLTPWACGSSGDAADGPRPETSATRPDPDAPSDPPALSALGAYPLDAARKRLRVAASETAGSGVSHRSRYLVLAQRLAKAMQIHQDASGAIIDPFDRREREYATASFALAAAAGGPGGELAGPAARALRFAAAALAQGKAADDTGDFYTAQLMLAHHMLGESAPADERGAWIQDLRRLAPDRAYQQTVHKRPAKFIHNWNLVALAGEQMRVQAGFKRPDGFVDAHLPIHLDRITDHGMYVDPGNALAYDAFGRHHLIAMLEHGYDGPHAAWLREAMHRGIWTAAMLMSPIGEWPAAGRSAHHQWNEAVLCAGLEWFARDAKRRGDDAEAGLFKRAAALALGSLERWLGGDSPPIVKNRIAAKERHGYDNYSRQVGYTLLTAAIVGTAARWCDDSIKATVAPPELGGYAVVLRDGAVEPIDSAGFHQTVVAGGGYGIVSEWAADPKYDATGLVRVHRLVRDRALRGISSGTAGTARFPAKHIDPETVFAVGPAWVDSAEKWHRLARLRGDEVRTATSVEVHQRDPEGITVVETHDVMRDGCQRIVRTFVVGPDGIDVEDVIEGDRDRMQVHFLVLVDDGNTQSQPVVTDGGYTHVHDGCKTVVTWRTDASRRPAPKARALPLREPTPQRDGWAQPLIYEIEATRVRYRIALEPA